MRPSSTGPILPDSQQHHHQPLSSWASSYLDGLLGPRLHQGPSIMEPNGPCGASQARDGRSIDPEARRHRGGRFGRETHRPDGARAASIGAVRTFESSITREVHRQSGRSVHETVKVLPILRLTSDGHHVMPGAGQDQLLHQVRLRPTLHHAGDAEATERFGADVDCGLIWDSTRGLVGFLAWRRGDGGDIQRIHVMTSVDWTGGLGADHVVRVVGSTFFVPGASSP